MSKINVTKWAKDNIVAIVVIPLIIGVHWGWRKLQDVPYLVEPSEKRDEMPIFSAFKVFNTRIIGNMEKLSKSSAEGEKK